MSHHVVFLEHIPFFSIPSATHDLTRYDLIRIDNFSKDSDSLSFQVPNTLDSPSHVLPHFLYIMLVHASSSTSIDTLLSRTLDDSSSPMVSLAPSEIVNPSLRRSTSICKSTKSQDFAYSCYSSSFTSFLAFIQCLCEPSSYKETILDSCWQQVMDEKLKSLHKTNT